MFRNDTPKWVRTCLIVPCLAASLCFGMVGCGGGDADTPEETPAAEEDPGTSTEEPASGTD